ncbi:protein-export chaperone SecB [Acetobacteraceae bacterium KSS8]|uniref:Protein-export protein SecB n=1 Tax=Endosaccharibacter trunci TaxID=2812733 RepID=A0ABT1W7C9_9PROT|nr:protein-export chaperone SecB [Acetobacteraceae bacterium KSS8]
MSDTIPPNVPGQNAAPPALPLTMNLQYTKDLSFEVPSGAEIFATLRANPQIAVNIDVQANRLQQEQNVFEVVLAIKAEASEPAGEAGSTAVATAGRSVFVVELAYAAVVTLGDTPETMYEPLLLVEVPRLIFPYARNIVSEVTRDGGFPPVVLQPIDFVALWQAKRAQAAGSIDQTAGNA